MDTCKSCGKPAEPDYSFPLCITCRRLLSKRPLPKWVKLSFFLVSLITLFSATKFPRSLVGAVALEKGRLAEKSHDFASAVEKYLEALNHFPDSPLAIGRLGIAQHKAGDISASRKTLGKIVGQKAPKEIIKEVQQMVMKSKEELESIKKTLKSLSDSLESLKAEIDKAEVSLKEIERRASKGISVDWNQYNQLAAKYNNLVDFFNQKTELGKSVDIIYENKFQETNALIEIYNSLISEN